MVILRCKEKTNFYYSISLHFIKKKKKIEALIIKMTLHALNQTNRIRVTTKATSNGQCASSRLEIITYSFE